MICLLFVALHYSASLDTHTVSRQCEKAAMQSLFFYLIVTMKMLQSVIELQLLIILVIVQSINYSIN